MSPVKIPTTPWFAVTIGLAGIIIGYAVAGGVEEVLPSSGVNADTPPAAQEPPPPEYDPATADDDAILGNEDASVTIIEFTDYQCPFCSRHYEQTFSQIKSDYIETGKVKYVVRDFALAFHPNAQKASEATECAADQGKFWEMHSLLFSKQDEWSGSSDGPASFKSLAAELGLNADSFARCLDEGTHAEEVKSDMQDGQASGIGGTPGFWIVDESGEGELISGAYPFATFKEVIDGMIE